MWSCYFVLGLFILPVKQHVLTKVLKAQLLFYFRPIYCPSETNPVSRRSHSSLMQFHDPGVVTDIDTRPRYGWLTSRCTALCGGSQWSEWDKPPHSLTAGFKKKIQKHSVLGGDRGLFSVTSLSGIQSMQELSPPVSKWLSLVTSVSWTSFHHCAVREPMQQPLIHFMVWTRTVGLGFGWLSGAWLLLGIACCLAATWCPWRQSNWRVVKSAPWHTDPSRSLEGVLFPVCVYVCVCVCACVRGWVVNVWCVCNKF